MVYKQCRTRVSLADCSDCRGCHHLRVEGQLIMNLHAECVQVWVEVEWMLIKCMKNAMAACKCNCIHVNKDKINNEKTNLVRIHTSQDLTPHYRCGITVIPI
jgi:hypothetical protein